jgi:hypothetical protein
MSGEPFTVRRSSAPPTGRGIPRVYLTAGVRAELGRLAVVRREVPVPPRDLRAIVAVQRASVGIADAEADIGGSALGGGLEEEAQERADSPTRVVRMDVGGRLAVGISEAAADASSASVRLEPLRVPLRRRLLDAAARVFGVRYVTLRVVLSLAVDAERAVVRVERTTLDLLGCDSGDRVVLDAAALGGDGFELRSISCQVLEIPEHEVRDRERRERSEDGHDARFRSSTADLGLEFDVPRVFVPGDLRTALGTEPGQSIVVRRDIPSLFGRSFREFGLLVLLSGLAVSELPIPIGEGWAVAFMLVGVAIALGVFFTGTSIRGRVRGMRRSWSWRDGRAS